MKGKEFKVEVIAELIVDRVLEERYINKETLLPVVDAVIRGFVKVQAAPSNHIKHTHPVNATRHLKALVLAEAERDYWKYQALNGCSEAEKIRHYNAVDARKIEASMNI